MKNKGGSKMEKIVSNLITLGIVISGIFWFGYFAYLALVL